MRFRRGRLGVVFLLPAGVAVFALSLVVALRRSLSFTAAVVLGSAVAFFLLALLVELRPRTRSGTDPVRRALLQGGAGLVLATAGGGLGRIVEQLTRDDPEPVLRNMARRVGAEVITYVRRGVHPGRSGDLQLVLAPFNTSNYTFESLGLRREDPRSSHALAWGYAQRVPVVVYGPGVVERPETLVDRVTLADLAPSTARLMGFEFPAPDGAPLPGLPVPRKAPRVIVTFVIDGGGWNVLQQWPDAWPHLKALMGRSIVYTNAVMGSFPAVTAPAHATIGTGAFPSRHGITGHVMQFGGRFGGAFGPSGAADPSSLLTPTLAEVWSEETRNKAWMGEFGYQIWHLGMIGKGGRPLGRPPVAILFMGREWRPQNPDIYRLPDETPERAVLDAYLSRFYGASATRLGRGKLCCSPPIVRFQGDVIEAAFKNEPIGQGPETSLVYINYKAPDYTGHVYNMLDGREATVLRAVDQELDRLRRILESRFAPGEFVLIVTADHGQCPLVDAAGGVRLDLIELTKDLNRAFGGLLWQPVRRARPSEVFLNGRALFDRGVLPEHVAAWLGDYRYRENIGPYIHHEAVQRGRLSRSEFAAVLPFAFIQRLGRASVARLGSGIYEEADPGVPAAW